MISTQCKFRNKRLESRSPRTNRPTETHRLVSLGLSSKAVVSRVSKNVFDFCKHKIHFKESHQIVMHVNALYKHLKIYQLSTFFLGIGNTDFSVVLLPFICGDE